MGPDPDLPRPDSDATCDLLNRAAAGDHVAVGDLLARQRPALVAFIDLHLDCAVRARVDASDVVQEAQADLARRMADYLARRPMPFHLWARKAAYERLLKARRAHRADRRDVGREVPGVDRSSVALAHALAAPGPTASEAAGARETAECVAGAVQTLPAADREVLLMRHVEGLSHREVACLLGIDPAAARQRYGRALFRLQKALGDRGLLGDVRMTDRPDDCDDATAALLAEVADEFLARRARGEAPDPDEFAARHPGAAGAVRRVLAALLLAAPPEPGPAVVPQPIPPAALGDFQIVREVGRGGMGVVYEAEQLSLRRRVALKVLPFAAVMDPRDLQRFKSEALAAAGLDHPNVVKVYGVGCDRGVHYIAMQFVDGRTLADLIRDRRGDRIGGTPPVGGQDPTRSYHADPTGGPARPAAAGPPGVASRTPVDAAYVRRVAEWGRKVADALEHAHGLGIVHRDVKPGNLLVDGRGEVYVADFGLARVAADPGVTATGDLLGTPRYMSPEQAAARHGLVDHRSDVYSLGATLYELLTLRPAFGGADRADVLRRVAADDPVPPWRIDRRIPAALETVVLKAMAKDPARRYQSAGELADDLRRFLEDRPVLARPPSLGEWVGTWSRRHRAVVRAGLAALVVAVAALATSTLLVAGAYESEARHRRDAEDAAGRADRARQMASDRETRLRLELYPTDLRRAREAWEDGESDRVRELLERHRPRDGVPDLRGFEWHFLEACGPAAERVLTGHESTVYSADLTGDGRLVATSGGQVVKLWDAASGRELHSLRNDTATVSSVRFSPDGRTLATCGADRTIRLFDVATWAETACLSGHVDTVTRISWSPDGTKLASGGYDHAVKVWDTTTRTQVWSLVGHTDKVRLIAWSPDSKLLASAGNDSEVRLWDTSKASSAGVLIITDERNPITGERRTGFPYCLAFNPSSEYLAYGWFRRVIVHDVRNLQPKYSFDAGVEALSISFCPDDPYLLVRGSGRVEAWDTSNPSRVALVRTWPLTEFSNALAVSRDNRTIVTQSKEGWEARLVDVSRQTGYSRVRYPGVCRAVIPDRGLVVCSGDSGTLTLRQFPGGEVRGQLDGHTRRLSDVAVSPAGDFVVTSDLDSAIFVWDIPTGRRVRQLTGHAPRPHLAVSPDRSLVAGGGRPTYVWRSDTGEVVKTLQVSDHGISRPAFSPDGSILATTDDLLIVLWRVGTWSSQTVLWGTQRTRALAFSPDSGVLAAVGEVNGATLWEVGTGRRLGVLAERTGPIVGAAFSPDGQTLATLGGDRTVRLWHVPTQRELFTLHRHDAPLLWVRFASPTQLLVGAESSRPGQSEVLVFPPLDR